LVPPFLHQAEELGLSEDQKARLKAILDGHRASMEPKAQADRKAHEALMDAVREGVGDLAALHRLAAGTQLALLQEAQQLHAECLGVLTREQREQSRSLRPPRPDQGGRPPRPEGHDRSRPERPGQFE
jgi:Spy/CpxP family protein refolding chaperone